jgi:hypothetical protein
MIRLNDIIIIFHLHYSILTYLDPSINPINPPIEGVISFRSVSYRTQSSPFNISPISNQSDSYSISSNQIILFNPISIDEILVPSSFPLSNLSKSQSYYRIHSKKLDDIINENKIFLYRESLFNRYYDHIEIEIEVRVKDRL